MGQKSSHTKPTVNGQARKSRSSGSTTKTVPQPPRASAPSRSKPNQRQPSALPPKPPLLVVTKTAGSIKKTKQTTKTDAPQRAPALQKTFASPSKQVSPKKSPPSSLRAPAAGKAAISKKKSPAASAPATRPALVAARSVDFANYAEEQVWLVDWQDGQGEFLCSIAKNKEGKYCAESAIRPRSFAKTFEVEKSTLVLPVRQAIVDWREGSGPFKVQLSLDDSWQLSASAKEFKGESWVVAADSEIKVLS